MRTVFQIKNALQKKFKKCQKRLHNIHEWCLFISINLINTEIILIQYLCSNYRSYRSLNNSYIKLNGTYMVKNYYWVKNVKFLWVFLPKNV